MNGSIDSFAADVGARGASRYLEGAEKVAGMIAVLASEQAISPEVLRRAGFGYKTPDRAFTLPLSDEAGNVVGHLRLSSSSKRRRFSQHLGDARLFNLFESVQAGRVGPVYFCTDEWSLLKLLELDPDRFVVSRGSTTSPDVMAPLRTLGREVIVTCDASEDGALVAEEVCGQLVRAGVRVRVRHLPPTLAGRKAPDGGAASSLRDFLTSAGNTLADFDALPFEDASEFIVSPRGWVKTLAFRRSL